MDLTVRGKRLRKQLADPREMDRAFGNRARGIRLRLGVLGQAKCLSDVPTGSPDYRHLLTGDRKGQFSVTIKDNWRIVFVPDHDPVPLLPDGGIDVANVTAIEIIEVVDYHGN